MRIEYIKTAEKSWHSPISCILY